MNPSQIQPGGRLRQATSGNNTYTLAYDALGRCVKRTLNNNTTFYYYDGEKPIQETGATLATNIYGLGIDEIVVRFEPSNVFYFYQDHEGSITHVRSNNGPVEQYRYDAFGQPTIRDNSGNVLTTSGPGVNNRFMFTGREWAPVNLGFYEYRARAYHPVLGRFMSEDPKGFDAGDYNLFRYCGNDPEDRVDPMGLASLDKILELRELAGLSSTYGRAYQSAYSGSQGSSVTGSQQESRKQSGQQQKLTPFNQLPLDKYYTMRLTNRWDDGPDYPNGPQVHYQAQKDGKDYRQDLRIGEELTLVETDYNPRSNNSNDRALIQHRGDFPDTVGFRLPGGNAPKGRDVRDQRFRFELNGAWYRMPTVFRHIVEANGNWERSTVQKLPDDTK